MSQASKPKKIHIFLLVSLIHMFVWSFIGCFDYFTWVLEAVPVMIGIPLLIILYHRFRLTNLTYLLISIHVIVLLIGAHYTYARMPLFNWIAEVLDLNRNHYDRLGHFVQGFVPAIIAREVLWRKSPLRDSKWLFFVVMCFCMAFSAVFELFEWIVAITSGEDAVAFLATQGDQWDTQKDMAFCLVGAVTALLALGKSHDKALRKISALSS